MLLGMFQITLAILTLSMGRISGLELRESDPKLVKIDAAHEWNKISRSASKLTEDSDADSTNMNLAEGGIEKRDEPKYVSKQKFHNWGGKRSVGRVRRHPKVVIEIPYSARNGKSDQSPN
ncbi:uncharacterized protein LOC129757116 [Uranotaenia lowii]|uniref:uncharacterized protein LOC129757116 n=1 Tax=Uranotaenia lowii TaxID=190385 RepID=UPI002479AD5F|nr:uncharacterized protein LOC129757116 [Uranotaenia lowii]